MTAEAQQVAKSPPSFHLPEEVHEYIHEHKEATTVASLPAKIRDPELGEVCLREMAFTHFRLGALNYVADNLMIYGLPYPDDAKLHFTKSENIPEFLILHRGGG